MSDFEFPVAYLEDSDFTKDGKLSNKDIPSDLPVVVMMQSSWCGHCKKAKPAFQEFANKMQGKVFCATIQADGDRQSEKDLGNRLKTIKSDFVGFPTYVLIKDGIVSDKKINGREVTDLIEFSS